MKSTHDDVMIMMLKWIKNYWTIWLEGSADKKNHEGRPRHEYIQQLVKYQGWYKNI